MRLFSDVSASIEDPYLRRAHELAVHGIGRTSPNPAVGCVIVSGGEVVGEGWHESAGGPHAEIIALRQAGERAADATAYVTLEPCTHQGRTPPCTDALIEAGVATVVMGMHDPHAIASGGAEILRSFGVRVRFCDDSAPFAALNEGWLKHLSTGLPWVTAKVAVSLDGKIARAEGVRTAMSASGSRSITMRLRSMADAVMVGARTANIDDPSLTARDPNGDLVERQPVRVVVCRDLIPSTSSLLSDDVGPVVLLVPRQRAADVPAPAAGVQVMPYDSSEGLSSALAVLADAGIRRLLIEPGPYLMASLWQSGLIDELVLIHAGGFAGSHAPGIYPGEGEGTLHELYRSLAAVEAGVVAGDAVTVWRPST